MQGVLGITLITLLVVGGRFDSIVCKVIPAAIEMKLFDSKIDGAFADDNSSNTGTITCGFTASIMTSAALKTSLFSDVAETPRALKRPLQ